MQDIFSSSGLDFRQDEGIKHMESYCVLREQKLVFIFDDT